MPVGGDTTQEKNRALARALSAHSAAGGQSVAALEAFRRAYPASAWRPSLLVNLGRAARGRGEFTAALALWDEAWRVTKDQPSRAGVAVADDAMGEMLGFAADLGHVPMLELQDGQRRSDASTRH